jgi:CHAP domain/Putative peptidoglycan binding domain
MRALRLTTPLMTGEDVREVQHLLAKNTYGTFFSAEFDGDFGELTNQACKRAKFWLGYPETGVYQWRTGGCADKLHDLLAGTMPLPNDHAERRKKRIADSKKVKLREAALKVAGKQLGVHEDPPGSNNVLYSRWYMKRPTGWKLQNEGPPWCAMFVSWCYTQSGSKAFDNNATRWAFCPFVVADARQGRHDLTLTNDPQPGDIAVYKFGHTEFRHIGLFEKWIDRGKGTFSAIEGNTSQASDDNGGEVQRRQRETSSGVAFVHVGR